MEDENAQKPEKNGNGGGRSLFAWARSLLPAKSNSDDTLREAIEELIEEEDTQPHSAVAAHERRLISNILQLRDLPVVDVMVPRADIVAIDIDAPREELVQLLAEKPHSRIPVYKGDLDNIIGVIHIKDMIAHIASGNSFEKRDILRDVLVVSPSMRVMDLLLQLRQSKVHIAFVVDEFGGIDGLITINDRHRRRPLPDQSLRGKIRRPLPGRRRKRGRQHTGRPHHHPRRPRPRPRRSYPAFFRHRIRNY
jgi:Mg2+/Co2+ transporter CorC